MVTTWLGNHSSDDGTTDWNMQRLEYIDHWPYIIKIQDYHTESNKMIGLSNLLFTSTTVLLITSTRSLGN